MILNPLVKPYFIKILNNESELLAIYEKSANIKHLKEFEKFQNFDIDDILGYDIDDFNTIVICTNDEIANLKEFSNLLGYKYKIIEASDMLFYNKLNISKADDTFKLLIEKYLINTYDIDNVLDKKLAGIELNYIDLKILKKLN